MKIVVDLCCGRGGWARGFRAVGGWYVIGFDVIRYDYPGQLVIQDVRTVSGMSMRGRVSAIVASPPCTEFSQQTVLHRRRDPDLTIVEACKRIAYDAGCPMILENVRDAQKWLGPAGGHVGSFYLWGDVPAILPNGEFWKGVWKTRKAPGHRDPGIRAMIPFPLAYHVAQVIA